jgi:hypothetical protein
MREEGEMEYTVIYVLIVVLLIAIPIAILRWILRVNTIVRLLEDIRDMKKREVRI